MPVINPPRLLAGDDRELERMQFAGLSAHRFSPAAAGLAMLGIYGVTAYAVQHRREGLAIRVALGASERAVVGIFLREGAWLLGLGTGAGLLGGIAVSWILRSRLLGVRARSRPADVSRGLSAARVHRALPPPPGPPGRPCSATPWPCSTASEVRRRRARRSGAGHRGPRE